MKTKPYEVIILAGGKGERLRPFTHDRPKPMIEICEQPLLAYTMRWLKSFGIRRVIIACGYKHNVISEYFGNGSRLGLDIIYSVEEDALGRGGAIKLASEQLENIENSVFVVNGDVLTNLSLLELYKSHLEKHAKISVVCVPLRSPYGIVEIDTNSLAKGFREKPVLEHWINAGIYLVDGVMFSQFPDTGDHEDKLFPELANKSLLYAFKYTGFWRTIDTGKDLEELKREPLLSNWP